jgi:hypothetical protein
VFFCFAFICYNTGMSLSWSQKRKFIYLGSIFIFLFIVVGVPAFLHYYKAPTCFDGKQNQTELGVDCGGSCVLLCEVQYVDLNVLWSRFTKVTDGYYNVLAYIENPNLNAGAANLKYTFKLYDRDGILLAQRFGVTSAPANKILTVFEPDMFTGNLVPARVDFSFTTQPIWLRQQSREVGLSTNELVVSREDTSPRLTATLTNKTVDIVRKIEAVAVVYNTDGNTIAFSRTIVENLGDKESRQINFNWPKPFGETVARSEIILRILN